MGLTHRLKPTSRICEIRGRQGHYLLARQGPANSRVRRVDLETGNTVEGSFLVKNSDIIAVKSYSEWVLESDLLQKDGLPAPDTESPQPNLESAPPQPQAVPQTIRIDPEVWLALQKRAVPFVETPNDVLRRLLGLGIRSKD
jgi:hypothetical protein